VITPSKKLSQPPKEFLPNADKFAEIDKSTEFDNSAEFDKLGLRGETSDAGHEEHSAGTLSVAEPGG
jgi:hypothetical protein